MTIDDLYRARCRTESDIWGHLPTISALAETCGHCTEFGVRKGNSTIALLHGLAHSNNGRWKPRLVSYDIEPHEIQPADFRPPGIEWQFVQCDTSTLKTIERTDLLLIDSLHTAAHVKAELAVADNVRTWLVFHDTMLYGSKGEDDGLGIIHAIFRFMQQNQGWRVHRHFSHCNGLLILTR